MRVEKGRRGRDLVKFLSTGNCIRVSRNNVNDFVHILVVMNHNMTAKFKIADHNIKFAESDILFQHESLVVSLLRTRAGGRVRSQYFWFVSRFSYYIFIIKVHSSYPADTSYLRSDSLPSHIATLA